MRLSLVFSILLTVAAGLSIVRRAENIGLTYETQMDIGFDKACLDEGAISKFLIDFQSEDSAKVDRKSVV